MAKNTDKAGNVPASNSSVFRQFSTLGRLPWLWPEVPLLVLHLVAFAVLCGVAWIGCWFLFQDQISLAQDKEIQLKTEFEKNYSDAVNLEALKVQREQIERYVSQLERQLPSKAEMSILLSDINAAGSGRGLRFELFKPGTEISKDYFAELPILIKVTGKYHDIGFFTADVANLSRIVTLGNMSITPAKEGKEGTLSKDGVLVMEATARTFRYLDADELAAKRKDGKEAKGKT